ncbi:hypothetical protein, variant 1 [Exophiala oligosperma]|nr:hypothetical protein, variant 1 [Exophiala oligosperma]KIW36422.1 hypothetical protein, variant 1 [Exophiala oligosperma]
MTGIILFSIGYLVTVFIVPRSKWHQNGLLRKTLAVSRYLSYRGYRISSLRWNSAPLGILFLGAVGIIFFFSMTLGPRPYYWHNTRTVIFGYSPPIATRTGFMSIACIPFIIATSTKANMVTFVTGVSHEKLQVFHRWISYACLVLALVHTFPFIIYLIHRGTMVKEWNTEIFYWTGTVALLFQGWLTFASFSILRNWWYESFKIAHRVSAAMFVLFLFWHCNFELSSWDYFIATAAIYVPCFLYAHIKTYVEHGFGLKATMNLESNDVIRIAIPVSFPWVPGQHIFVRFRALGIHALTSHPFTICSLPSLEGPSEAVLHIRPQAGFTAQLYRHAAAHPGIAIPVFLEGPYGGIEPGKFVGSDRVIVVAGGSGAAWMLPLIELFARKATQIREVEMTEQSTPVQTFPSLHAVLATRDPSTFAWFQEAANKILARYLQVGVSSMIDVEIHITRGIKDNLQREIQTELGKKSIIDDGPDSNTLRLKGKESDIDVNESGHFISCKMLSGRPNLPALIRKEGSLMTNSQKTLGIFACGPSSMQHDLRVAAASENVGILRSSGTSVYLHLEHFSWA